MYTKMCHEEWRGVDPTTMDASAPAVRIDALDMFVELLSQVEDDASSDAFYSRLCEATCALTSMDRAVIFRYDEVRRRVRAAGAYGIDLEAFADAHVTVESAPVARQSLRRTACSRSRGLRRRGAGGVPRPAARVQPRLHAAGRRGRWFGVILSDPASPALLPTRSATCCGRSARPLRWPRSRASRPPRAPARGSSRSASTSRDVHESVIQRLFGVQLVFSSSAELTPEARERIAAELQAALVDLRRALQRPLGRIGAETQTTLLEEVDRLAREHPDLHLVLKRGSGA